MNTKVNFVENSLIYLKFIAFVEGYGDIYVERSRVVDPRDRLPPRGLIWFIRVGHVVIKIRDRVCLSRNCSITESTFADPLFTITINHELVYMQELQDYFQHD